MTTKTRIALAAVLTTAAAATLNGAASARDTAAPFGCRAKIAGHTWMLTGHGFTCASAAAVIKATRHEERAGHVVLSGLARRDEVRNHHPTRAQAAVHRLR
jgi:hypothetical protein